MSLVRLWSLYPNASPYLLKLSKSKLWQPDELLKWLRKQVLTRLSRKVSHRSLSQHSRMTLTHYCTSAIAKDIQHIASYFSMLNYSRVHRHCNTVAHSLARRAISTPNTKSGWKKYH